MANLATLPPELISHIFSFLPQTLQDLCTYSSTFRQLSSLANQELYQDIDLTYTESTASENEQTSRRQERLIMTIAENPNIGALVQTLKLANRPDRVRSHSVNVTIAPTISTSFASNLINLTTAHLTPSPISVQIIQNIHLYKHLTHLSISGLHFLDYIWPPTTTTSLESVCWTLELPAWNGYNDYLDEILVAVLIVERTCPQLKSLDLKMMKDVYFSSPYNSEREEPCRPIKPTIPEYDPKLVPPPISRTTNLKSLQHFGLQVQDSSRDIPIEDTIHDLLQPYLETLTSISVPLYSTKFRTSTLQFLLDLTTSIPNLTHLKFTNVDGDTCGDDVSPDTTDTDFPLLPIEFWDRFTRGLVESGIAGRFQRLEIERSGCVFGVDLGKCFVRLEELRELVVGDEMVGSRWDNGGFVDFEGYSHDILLFILHAPRSLQILKLSLNGHDLQDDIRAPYDPLSSQFSCILDRSTSFFAGHPNLRSVDIYAWITDVDGGGQSTPEKAVMFRYPRSSFSNSKFNPSTCPQLSTTSTHTPTPSSFHPSTWPPTPRLHAGIDALTALRHSAQILREKLSPWELPLMRSPTKPPFTWPQNPPSPRPTPTPSSAAPTTAQGYIFTSRLDNIYQHPFPLIIQTYEPLKNAFPNAPLPLVLPFRNQSAEELGIWCQGLSTSHPGPAGRGRPKGWPSMAWPHWRDGVKVYGEWEVRGEM